MSLSRRTLYSLIDSGELRTVKLGGATSCPATSSSGYAAPRVPQLERRETPPTSLARGAARRLCRPGVQCGERWIAGKDLPHEMQRRGFEQKRMSAGMMCLGSSRAVRARIWANTSTPPRSTCGSLSRRRVSAARPWRRLPQLRIPPPVAFVRQANIAHGPQQVNNGATAAPCEQTQFQHEYARPRGNPKIRQTDYWSSNVTNGWTPERGSTLSGHCEPLIA
jgi:hypothetical protein